MRGSKWQNFDCWVKIVEFAYIIVSLISSCPMDDVYVVKVAWFMSAVMLWFLLHAVICISELWHYSSLTGLQLSAQQSRRPITNTACHTRETKCKREGVEEMKKSKKKEWQSKTVAETKKDETEGLVSTARFSAGVFHYKWDDALCIMITQLIAPVFLLHCRATVACNCHFPTQGAIQAWMTIFTILLY